METNKNLNLRGAARHIVIFAATAITLITLALTFSSTAASAQAGDFDLIPCTQGCNPEPDPIPLPPVFLPPPTPVPLPTLPPVFVPPPTPVPVPTLPPVIVNPPAPEPEIAVAIFHSCEAGGVVVAYTNTGGPGAFGVTVAHDGEVPFLANVLAPAGVDETFFVELDEGATVTVSAADQGGTFTADCEPDVPADAGDVPADAGDVPADAGDVPADAGDELADAGDEPVDADEPPAADEVEPDVEFDAKEEGSDPSPAVGEESAAGPIDTVEGTDPILLLLGGAIAALLLILILLIIGQGANRNRAH